MNARTSGSSSITSTRSGAGAACAAGPSSAAVAGSTTGSSALRNSRLTAVPSPGRLTIPARLARHAIDHRQAEAGALADLLGGEERLERPFGHLGRHAGPAIGNCQL